MTMAHLGRRLERIERRLPPPPPPPNSAAELAHWFTSAELGLLVSLGEDSPAFRQTAEELLPCAMARREAGANMTSIDQEERAAERVIRVDDPNRPHDPRCKFYLKVAPHPLEPGRWTARDDWYRERYGARWPLPLELTTADVEYLCPYQPGDHRCRCAHVLTFRERAR